MSQWALNEMKRRRDLYEKESGPIRAKMAELVLLHGSPMTDPRAKVLYALYVDQLDLLARGICGEPDRYRSMTARASEHERHTAT